MLSRSAAAEHTCAFPEDFSLPLSSVLRSESVHEESDESSEESSRNGASRASSASSLLSNTQLLSASSVNSKTERRDDFLCAKIVDLHQEISSLKAELARAASVNRSQEAQLATYKGRCALLEEDPANIAMALKATSAKLLESQLLCAQLKVQMYEMNDEMEAARSNTKTAKEKLRESYVRLTEMKAKVNLQTRGCSSAELSPFALCPLPRHVAAQT